MASPQTLSDGDRRVVAAWAADCAERVLPLFEADAPGDDRPRDAISRARAYARGELSAAELIGQRFVAFRAAGAAGSAAGKAAATAAAHAAAAAHMGAHALGAAAYAARAAALASLDQPDAADDEVRWQLDHATGSVRAALRLLPPLGEDRSGPLGPGLLASGDLAARIREIQARVARS